MGGAFRARSMPFQRRPERRDALVTHRGAHLGQQGHQALEALRRFNRQGEAESAQT